MIISNLGNLLNGEGIKSITFDVFIRDNPLDMTDEEMDGLRQFYATLTTDEKRSGLNMSSKRNKGLGKYKVFP